MFSLKFTMTAGLFYIQSVAFAAPSASIKVEPCPTDVIDGMSCIPGGPFTRGSEAPRTCKQGEVRRIPAAKPNHKPVTEVHVSTFYMDKTEVTYAAYQRCVKAGNVGGADQPTMITIALRNRWWA